MMMINDDNLYYRGAQSFWAKGRSALFLVHSRAKTKL